MAEMFSVTPIGIVKVLSEPARIGVALVLGVDDATTAVAVPELIAT